MIKYLIAITLLIISSTTVNAIEQNKDAFAKSIVRLRVTYQYPNFIMPWKSKNPNTIQAIGIVVQNNYVIVLASMIENATLIEVKKYSSYQFAKVDIIKIDLEANLAILKISDPEFSEDLAPLDFSEKIFVNKPVKIFQLDNAGTVQEANGRLMTLDMEQSALGHTELPVFDITSNEKFNGAGELIVENNRPIGILAYFNNSKNYGKMIPSFLLNRFISSPIAKQHSIFSFKGFYYKPLIQKTDKEYYGLHEKQEGVIVTDIVPYSSASGVLQPGDVILKYGNNKIDAKGYFDHPVYDKQSLAMITFSTPIEGELPIEIIRNGKLLKVKTKLKTFPYNSIQIPHSNYEFKQPGFYSTGGFMFLELSEFMLREWGKDWRNKIKRKLLYLNDFHRFFKNEGQKGRIIVLSQVFPDNFNNGYTDLSMLIVHQVNGKEVHFLRDMKTIIDESKEKFISIILENGIEIVMDKEGLTEANKRIMKNFELPTLDSF